MGLRTTAFEVAEVLGWSVDQLAEKSGVARSTLYAIRAGDRRPGPKVIAGLMRAFPHLTFERLFVPAESTKSDVTSKTSDAKVAA
jgi:transcriptional regulator with XRE-family HTH domain